MADYTVRIVAETEEAEKKVKKLEREVNRATEERKVNISFPSLNEVIADVQTLGNTLKTTYDIARKLPILGGRFSDLADLGDIALDTGQKVAQAGKLIAGMSISPGKILSGSFNLAVDSATDLSKKISDIGFTIFGVTQSVNLLKSTFGSFFDDTVGREIKLQEALLRTKTTLASTADVAVNGKRLTDPLEAIIKLEKPIEQTIESIRARSLDIAGTTSDAIVQVFGVVASQIGNIGGNLKDAEDLAITFSAALGTLGLSDPFYATQEIRSILTGTIDQNSVLARSLGLTNEEVTKAKSSADGLVEFLKKRLAAFTAGQSLAAKGFAGITSNIEEFAQEIKRNLGKGLLQPLLEGLTVLYQRLQLIFKPALGIADAIGRAAGAATKGVIGGIAAAPALQGFSERDQKQLFERGEGAAVKAFIEIQKLADTLRPTFAALGDEVTKALVQIVSGLSALAKGFAVFKVKQLQILVEQFIGLASLLNSTVIPAFNKLMEVYGWFLETDLAASIARLSVDFGLLERTGVMPLARSLFTVTRIFSGAWSLIQQFGRGVQWLSVQIAGLVDILVVGLSHAVSAVSRGIANLGQALLWVATTGVQAVIATIRIAIRELANLLLSVAELATGAGPQFYKIAEAILAVRAALRGIDPALEKASVDFAQFGVKAKAALEGVALKTAEVKAGITAMGTKVKEGFTGIGQAAGKGIKGMIGGILAFGLQMAAFELIILAVYETVAAFQAKTKEISEQTRAEIAIKRLSTVYADVGENASAAARAARDFEQAIVTTRIDTVSKKLGELGEKIRSLTEIQADKNPVTRFLKELGAGLRNIADPAVNAELQKARQRFAETGKDQGLTQVGAIIKARRQEVARLQQELSRLAAFDERQSGAKKASEDIQVLAKERQAMEKELKEMRKQISKELTDFEWNERQKGLQLEQQMREAMLAKERTELERRQQRENQNLGQIGQSLKQIFDQYEQNIFDAQVESQKRQFELASKREELEKQVSDYRYKLEEQTAKLREKMGQFNKKIVDYETAERIRASKEVLQYTMRAAAIQSGSYIVGPGEQQQFMDAAARQGVSATRALAVLKTGGAAQLSARGISPEAPKDLQLQGLVELFPFIRASSDEEFMQGLNAHSKAFFGQFTAGRTNYQAAVEELGSQRWVRSKPTPQPRLTEVGDILRIQQSTARMSRAADANINRLSELYAFQTSTATTNNLTDLFQSLQNPSTWGVAKESVADLREQLRGLQNESASLASNGISPLHQGIATIATRIQTFATDILSKPGVLKTLGVAPDKQTSFTKLAQGFLGKVDSANGDLGKLSTLYDEIKKTFKAFPQAQGPLQALIQGIFEAFQNLSESVKLQVQTTIATITRDLRQASEAAKDLRPGTQSLIDRFVEGSQALLSGPYSLRRANLLSDLGAERERMTRINSLEPEQRTPEVLGAISTEIDRLKENYREQNAALEPATQAVVKFEQRLALAVSATDSYIDASRGLLETFLSGTVDMREALANFSTSIAQGFMKQFLDMALAPMRDQMLERMKKLFGVQSAQDRAQEAVSGLATKQDELKVATDNLRGTIEKLNTTLSGAGSTGNGMGGPDAFWAPNNAPKVGQRVGYSTATSAARSLQVVPYQESDGEMMTRLAGKGPEYVAEIESYLEQSFKGIGESLTYLGTTAETTGAKAGAAAADGEKSFGKFLGSMTGVATGALAITGAIQAMQDSQGGTYGTLMGIAGVLGGLGSIFGGFASLGRASGGPVSASRPYIVGEVGPELFIPGANGTIIPNDKIAFTDASTSALEGGTNGMSVPFQQSGSSTVNNAFSTLYGASIPFTKSTERVLAERSEREAIAALTSPKPLDVRYESKVINSVEYVTAEQHQRGMAQAAERGRALTLDALQNSVKSRRRVGMA